MTVKADTSSVLTKTITPLFEEYGKGSQDLTYTAVYPLAPHWEPGTPKPEPKRVRISIRRDSYDAQSYARAEVWSVALDKWEYITSIHYSQMISLADSYYDRDNDGKLQHHMPDVERLLRQAKAILT